MPVLPTQYSASSSRQPRRARYQPQSEPPLRPRSVDDSASFIADTSSRIRLRSDHASSSYSSSDDFTHPRVPLHLPLSDASSGSSRSHLSPRAHDPYAHETDHFLTTHADSAIESRQYFFALPLTYKGLDAGPSPGTVVGITLGSVLGFLILVWLANSIINSPRPRTRYIEGDASEIVVTRPSDRSAKRRRTTRTTRTRTHRSERTARSEATALTASISSASHAPPPPRQPSPPRRTERIIREEVRVRTESRPPPVSMPMPPPPMPMPQMPEMRETININIDSGGGRPARRVDGDDVVEVIEEHSDVSAQPAPTNRRGSRAAFRTVDPTAYGGGNFSPQEVRRPSRFQ